jgi:hypothetical protein
LRTSHVRMTSVRVASTRLLVFTYCDVPKVQATGTAVMQAHHNVTLAARRIFSRSGSSQNILRRGLAARIKTVPDFPQLGKNYNNGYESGSGYKSGFGYKYGPGYKYGSGYQYGFSNES